MHVNMCINAKLVKEGSFRIIAKLVKEELKSEIIQILLSHFPRYGDVQVIF